MSWIQVVPYRLIFLLLNRSPSGQRWKPCFLPSSLGLHCLNFTWLYLMIHHQNRKTCKICPQILIRTSYSHCILSSHAIPISSSTGATKFACKITETDLLHLPSTRQNLPGPAPCIAVGWSCEGTAAARGLWGAGRTAVEQRYGGFLLNQWENHRKTMGKWWFTLW